MAKQHDVKTRHGTTVAGSPASQQVSWWLTHEFIAALVAQHNNMPIAGTPAWCALSDTDPAKLIALAAAGEHHVLRVETNQIAMAEASHEIASAADWPSIARQVRNRASSAYIERKRTA